MAAHKPRKTPSPAANERGEPRSEQAYRYIVDAIKQGTLPPGTRIREVDLAERTGPPGTRRGDAGPPSSTARSRTPLPEAHNRLQGEGLLATDPARAPIITERDQSRENGLYAVREALEGTARWKTTRLNASNVR